MTKCKCGWTTNWSQPPRTGLAKCRSFNIIGWGRVLLTQTSLRLADALSCALPRVPHFGVRMYVYAGCIYHPFVHWKTFQVQIACTCTCTPAAYTIQLYAGEQMYSRTLVHWDGDDATPLHIEVDPQRRRLGRREADFALQAREECTRLKRNQSAWFLDFAVEYCPTTWASGVGTGGRLDATGCACDAGPAKTETAARHAHALRQEGETTMRLMPCAIRVTRSCAHLHMHLHVTGTPAAGTTPPMPCFALKTRLMKQ